MQLKVALVHDWGNQLGGAENVLDALKELFPDAPVYMSIYAPDLMPEAWKSWDIRTSWLNRLPGTARHHRWFLPLYPRAFETMDFREFDVVISNKSGFCHGIITPPHTLHIDYCLTPTRYVWDYHTYVGRERLAWAKNLLVQPLLYGLRSWDRRAAQRVNCFIAISHEVQRRIREVYGRGSSILYPPVDVARFRPDRQRGDFFLLVSRLVPHKRIDVAVAAFTQLGLPLKIVGEGRARHRLESEAGPNVQFLGRLPDDKVTELYETCRAFIFPQLEDFGITALEANAAGAPVLAFRAGGALDTVDEGQTGLFFDEQTPESLAGAVRAMDSMSFDPAALHQHALKFDKSVFQAQMRKFVDETWEAHQRSLEAGLPTTCE